MDFGKRFSDQVKLFPQKNLFCNPMVREIPPIKPIESARALFRPRMKLDDDEKQSALIQTNPLSSEAALKSRKETIRRSQIAEGEEDCETPVVKSLFDAQGNSKSRKALEAREK